MKCYPNWGRLCEGGSKLVQIVGINRGLIMEGTGKLERLSAAQVAELLGLGNTDQVWRRARLGQIPCVRLGRLMLFHRETILAWLHQESAVSTSKPAA